jgi:tRNA (cytidine/uridine-2'-O-)-methyltransferase
MADTNRIERHVVLVAPEIHWNTGNIGRTCLGAGAFLHLIRPLGFSLDNRRVKRAGLDYWPKVKVSVWEGFSEFEETMAPVEDEVALFTKSAGVDFWRMPRPERQFLVFGSETKGLPHQVLERYPGSSFRIPTTGDIRSLNLSTAVGIALYESIRTLPYDREIEASHD